MVTFADIQAAAKRLQGIAHRTPVVRSETVDRRVGAQVYFKCENLQRMGAFKFRGAYNALSQLEADQARRGVIAYSSGNHAQAVALAGRLLGIPSTIVMPQDAPAVKLAATRGYGAHVVTYDKLAVSREALTARLALEQGLTVIPPFDHPWIIAGQGTAALELLEETRGLDLLLVCLGGGGLLSGSAIAAKALAPRCKVIGVEPEAGNDGQQSFRSGALVTIAHPETIADGARTVCLGQLTFPIIQQHVDALVTVSDAELISTMFYLMERLKLVVEPTGALAAAALLHGKIPLSAGQRVGVLISGGNVDLRQLATWFGQIN